MSSLLSSDHHHYMQKTLALARKAERMGEVPVGALVVFNHQIIGKGYNCPIMHNDPTAHAEIMALRQAAHYLNNYRLMHCTLYVSLEPCLMCLGAMLYARIPQLYFGAYDAKVSTLTRLYPLLSTYGINHRLLWKGGLMEQECSYMLQGFFQKRR